MTLGGDCLIDLAPMAYLNRRYDGKLGALWVDAHPDVMSPAEFSHAHAHVLGMLLGRGDAAFTAEVERKLNPARLMIAGMSAWTQAEGRILQELGIQPTAAANIADSSQPILDWIKAEGITHLAVLFDLDVLDPPISRRSCSTGPSSRRARSTASCKARCGWGRSSGCCRT